MLKAKILQILNIQREEIQPVTLLFLLSFLIGTIRIFCMTSSLTIFLDHYSFDDLPIAYILTSIITVVIGVVYLKLGQYLSVMTLVLSNFAFLIAGTIFFRIALEWQNIRWPAMGLSIWFQIVFTLTNLAFWVIASKCLDVRQGKRLFPLITTGDIVAAALGGILTGTLSSWMGVKNILLFAIGASILACLLLLYLKSRFHEQLTTEQKSSTQKKINRTKASWKSFLTPYILCISLYFIMSEFIYYFVDNAFNSAVQEQQFDSNERANFFGNYSAVAAISAFFIRTFVAGRLISKFGIGIGFFALPIMILLGSSLVIVGAFLPQNLLLVFWFMTSTRLFDKVFRGIKYSSMTSIYQPLMKQSSAVQTFMETVIQPIAGGLTGVILLIVHHYFSVSAVELSYCSSLICIIWIFNTIYLMREYRVTLSKVLRRRRIKSIEFALSDKKTIEFLEEQLQSDAPENVIYALDLIEKSDLQKFFLLLPDLLEHPSFEVRENVLIRIENHQIRDPYFLNTVKSKMSTETFLSNQERFLRLMSMLSDEYIDIGIKALSHKTLEMRRGAMIGLLKSGTIEGVVEAGSRLLNSLKSEEITERIFVAEVLGKAEISELYRPILTLLSDSEMSVRKAALIAAEKLKHPMLAPMIIHNFVYPELQPQSMTALVSLGPAAISHIESGFKTFVEDEDILNQLIRVASLIQGKQATDFLYDKIDFEDQDVRHSAIIGLKNCNYQAPLEKYAKIKHEIASEVSDAIWTYAALVDLQSQKNALFLIHSLEDEIQQNRKILFALLSFLYDTKLLSEAWQAYEYGASSKKAYALELVENLISRELKELVFPVLEEIPISDRLQQLKSIYPQEKLGLEKRTIALLHRSDKWTTTWTKCCLFYFIGKNNLQFTTKYLLVWLESQAEKIAQETAVWALVQLNPIDLQQHLEKLSHSSCSWIAELVQKRLENNFPELMVERVFELKAVDLFKNTKERFLAGIVPNLEKIYAPEDSVLFEQGDSGDTMYILIQGEVELYNEQKTLSILKENQFFGEFAILTSRARSATAYVKKKSILYRLHQDILYDLLETNIEVGKSFIDVICNKIRNVN